jgi:hypothetical protein
METKPNVILNAASATLDRPAPNRAVCALVVTMVKDVLAPVPGEIVDCVGLKEQASPAGKPEQLNSTVPARPFLEVTWKFTGADVAP